MFKRLSLYFRKLTSANEAKKLTFDSAAMAVEAPTSASASRDEAQIPVSSSADPRSSFGAYLLYFARNDLSDIGHDEVRNVAAVFGARLELRRIPEDGKSPLAIVSNSEDIGEDLLRRILGRTVLVKCAVRLWAFSLGTSESLAKALSEIPDDLTRRYKEPDVSFKFTVESIGKSLSMDEKLKIIDEYRDTGFAGKVKLKNPDLDFWVIEYHGLNHQDNPQPHPLARFFGQWILDGNRKLIQELSLKERKYIGNTSMDPEISLIMSNLAMVRESSFVFDPFVGTGSLLIAAAQHGATVAGADIDYKTIHGIGKSSRANQKWRKKDETIGANFSQYGLDSRFLDVLVADSSRACLRPLPLFDAIVTDPPYGIREASVKVGTHKVDYTIPPEYNEPGRHFPESVQYDLNDSYCDLLNFAARYLNVGGRLACWFPVYRPHYDPDQIPTHSCLRLIGNYEQILSHIFSRRLLLMEKTCSFREGTRAKSAKNHFDKSLRDRYFGLDSNADQEEERSRKESEEDPRDNPGEHLEK